MENRDRLESLYMTWEARSERVKDLITRLTGWNGRVVPYVLGLADSALLAFGLHLMGLPHNMTLETVKHWANQLWG